MFSRRYTGGSARGHPAGFEQLWIGFAINFLFKEEPTGPYPAEKVGEVIGAIRESQPDGVVVFCAEQIEEFGVADALCRALREAG